MLWLATDHCTFRMRRIGARYELQGFSLWKLEEEPEEEETPVLNIPIMEGDSRDWSLMAWGGIERLLA